MHIRLFYCAVWVKEPLVLAIALHYQTQFLHLLPQVIQHGGGIIPLLYRVAPDLQQFDSDPEKALKVKLVNILL